MPSLSALSGRNIYLDANVFIYGMEQLTPWDTPARGILQMIDTGEIQVVTSELTLAECLTKPIRIGNTALVDLYRNTFVSEGHRIC